MSLPEVVGIAVDPVRGVAPATSESVRTALVKALQDADIPASAAPGGEHAYHLMGEATKLAPLGAVTQVVITWTVTDAAGSEIGTDTDRFTIDSAGWQSGSADLGAPMRVAAGKIAAILHLPGAAPAPPPKPSPPPLRLVLDPVTGAPGDGDTSLPRALAYVLQDAGVDVLDQPEPSAPHVGGKVTRTALPGGQENIRIVWTVSDAAHKSIGTVAQENAVPRGSLDGPWSDAAAAVAAAAADSVRGLVAQAMQQGHSAP
jgi:hypothetical protein